ncbi:hypothetical protein R6Q59_026830 [Mikania micrantha]
MVHLFLSKPDWNWDGGDDSVKQRISLLNDLESMILLLVADQSRSEARLWLCKDVSGISSLSHMQQCELFLTLLRTSSQKRDLAAQILQMIFEKQPRKAGSILAKKSDMLEEFFRVENFLENVPEFWSSREFADTLKDGDILFLDMNFFISMFLRLMYKEDMEEIWKIINEFLMEESFSSLCSHLLITLNESELCVFLDLLTNFLDSNTKPNNSGEMCDYLEVILPRLNGLDSIDELLLLNTVVNRRRQLVQLLQEDEHREEKIKIKDIVQKICSLPENPN